jgi:hypothetical protein
VLGCFRAGKGNELHHQLRAQFFSAGV